MQSPKAIALVGLKHVGKSSVGRLLAAATARAFVDSDDEIVRRYAATRTDLQEARKTPREVYQTEGADRFKALESEAITSILGHAESVVIATGGGICDNDTAYPLLLAQCTTVFLDDDIDVLYKRATRRGLPAFLDTQRPYRHFVELSTRRRARYLESATYRVDASGRSVKEVTAMVLEILKQEG